MTINTRTMVSAAAGAVLVLAACGGSGKDAVGGAAAETVAGASASAPAVASSEASGGSGGAERGAVPGTPAGGMGTWIAEVRTGLAELPELVQRDVAAAKNRALQLYVTRQEYVEIYYGTTGRAVKDARLAEAVMAAEARFHDLLTLLNQPDGSVAVAGLEAAVRALGEQYDVALRQARNAGVNLERLELAEAAR